MSREKFLAKLGAFPASCSLDARVEAREPQDGYKRERITWAGQNGERVPAYLLIPDNLTQPAPGVLCIHQHNNEYHLGKSEPVGLAGNPQYFFALDLCRRGFAVLAPDMPGMEERQVSPEEFARWQQSVPEPPQGREYERFLGLRRLMEGSTLQALCVWDMSRAVDYLCSRPEVDAARLGAIGHSFGGQEVCWALLHDRRLKAGVCSCGIGTFESYFAHGVSHNIAAYVPGMLEVGDIDTLIAAIAPTPLLMTAGSKDWLFPMEGMRQIAATAGAEYSQSGAANAFQLREFEGAHSCPDDVRGECYEWLKKWLRCETEPHPNA